MFVTRMTREQLVYKCERGSPKRIDMIHVEEKKLLT